MFMPISGFPREVKNSILYVAGMIIVSLSIIAIRKEIKERPSESKSDIFEENKPPQVDSSQNSNHIA